MKIKILDGRVIGGKPALAGEIVEASGGDAAHFLAMGWAEKYVEPPKPTVPPKVTVEPQPELESEVEEKSVPRGKKK